MFTKALVILGLTGMTGIALHGALKSSSPRAGDRLAAVPRELRLTFNERVELPLARVTLSGPSGPVVLGAPALHPDSNSVLVVPVGGPLSDAGAYTVRWRIAGADGHPVRDTFQFVIAPGAVGLADPAVATAPDARDTAGHHPSDAFPRGSSFDAESPLYVAIRWLSFITLIGTIGMVAFRILLALAGRSGSLPHEFSLAASSYAAQLGLALTMALLGTALLRALAQSYALHGPAGAFSPGLATTMVLQTTWGRAWILHIAAALIALPGFWFARRGATAGWRVAAAAALGLSLAAAFSGHASAAQRLAPLPVITDALHILAVSGWLGALFAIVAIGLPLAHQREDRTTVVAALIQAFSPTALVYAGVAVATGVFAAWIHLGSLPALWQSAYGRTLLAKVLLLAGVFLTGAYNWLRVRPALHEERGATRLGRSATAELVIGVLVLLVTAVLVATPTPMPETGAAPTVAR